MIHLSGIEKYYKSGLKKSYILSGVDLEVKEGEFVTIMGPSGAGKSTLLNIIGMLEAPSAGVYHLLNEPVHTLSEKKRSNLHKSHIGFVFQAYHLIDELTVYENIETPLIYRNIKGGERKSRVADILDRFQIVAKKGLFPHQLSGGQQQLVGIARAIVGRASFVIGR